MNNKSTTCQWENAETLKAEKLKGAVPQFKNEQQYLDGLRTFMRAGRESRAPGVARVAIFWERKITFSILVAQQRLQRSKAVKAKAERLKTEKLKLQVSVANNNSTPHPGANSNSVRRTSSGLRPPSPQSGEGLKASPSSLRIRVGVSPSPG